MKILVTGGAGYLGSVVVGELLEGGHFVKVYDANGESLLPFYGHDNFEFIKGDIRNRSAVSQALDNVDAVVHLAAIVGDALCSKNPELAKQINQEATYALVDLCKKKEIPRFIFVTTCSVYGISEGIANEDSSLKTTSPYTETKVNAERYVLNEKDPNFHPCILRLATLYGLSPKPQFNSLANELVWNAAFKKEIVIYGSDQWRPLTHVYDAARAIIKCLTVPLERISGQIFNVGSDSGNYRKIQIAKLIFKHFPDAKIKTVDDIKASRSYKVSFKRISTVLGFKTTKTLEDGIVEIKDAIEKGIIQK